MLLHAPQPNVLTGDQRNVPNQLKAQGNGPATQWAQQSQVMFMRETL
jgi:hypothetical protein